MEFGKSSREQHKLKDGQVFKGNVRVISGNTYQYALGEPKELEEDEYFGEQAYDAYGNPIENLEEDLRPLIGEESMDFKKTGR